MNKPQENPDPKKDVRDLTPGKDAKGGHHHHRHEGHGRKVDFGNDLGDRRGAGGILP